ncbi:hypothetical protein [Pseudonocardia sp. NPDC046786]|uniref:hypothetical protein n=1 Tax=Pseudonocardia sp. NPDC046786 TaxID=3155471 RepID=UPI0033E6D7F4
MPDGPSGARPSTRRRLAAALPTVGVLLLTGSVLRLVAVVVLVPLATAAARVAIGRDLAPEPSAARAVGPARPGCR